RGQVDPGPFCHAPAAAAGLTGGDVILAINGQAVGAPSTLTGVLAQYRPGQTVRVTWMDTSGQRHTSSLTLTTGHAKKRPGRPVRRRARRAAGPRIRRSARAAHAPPRCGPPPDRPDRS